MSAINDGGPAFPVVEHPSGGEMVRTFAGMTLRDYIAAKALAALIAKPGSEDQFSSTDELAGDSYGIADAMLRARSGGGS